MRENKSEITIRSGLEKVRKHVTIGGEDKPDVNPEIVKSWQSLVNIAADIADVPSALIMKLHPSEIEVFISSEGRFTPYKPGDRESLNHGLYCETVIGTRKELLVPDATKDPVWSTGNPDVPLGMIAYLGLPILWPDGEAFGTICLLDNKANHFNDKFRRFLKSVRQRIEGDLRMLVLDQQLQRVNEELEALNARKTLFLSIISHDIRGGLGSTNEMLKLILERLGDYDWEKLRPLLHGVSQHIDTTYHALVDLLLWSRSDMLGLKPEKQEMDVVAVLEQVVEFFEPALIKKQLGIAREFHPDRPVIEADVQMLQTVFRNVVSNAVKHSKDGGLITLRVSKGAAGCVVEIRDQGAGMQQEELDKLFLGPRSEGMGDDVESGAGIGLLIAKDFLDMHDARVEIESEPDKGTLFRMVF